MKILKKISVVLLAVLMFACSNPLTNETSLLPTGDGVYTGYIRGEGWTQEITYEKINGVNIYEGDIAVPDEDIYSSTDAVSKGIVTDARLWPNNTVYYGIASNVYSRYAITSAMQHIEANSVVQFVEHSAVANPSGNYLYFKPDSGSWSYIGCMNWGKQDLALASWANTGTAVHEICHAVGIYHEQSRKDRDQYLTIHFANIQAGMEGNFSKATGVRDFDIGFFDFGSIMLYGPTAFSVNGQPTITKIDGSTYSTQRNVLSSEDIKGLNYLYTGTNPTDTEAPTVPTNLRETSISSASASVAWNASSDNIGVTGYMVYVNNTQNAVTSSTSVTISNLTANTTYNITVSAIDAAGNESAKSSALSVTTDPSTGGGTEWTAYTPYQTGDIVTYGGVSYRCRQSHTSLPGWTPAAVLALWIQV